MNDRNVDDRRIKKITLVLGTASVAVAIAQLFVANFAGVLIACLFIVAGGSRNGVIEKAPKGKGKRTVPLGSVAVTGCALTESVRTRRSQSQEPDGPLAFT
jgi:hypothetical protein